MTLLSDPITGPDGLDGLAREIAAQLAGKAVPRPLPSRRGPPASAEAPPRPELATALTSISRAADLLMQARADLAAAGDRADRAEARAATLDRRVTELEEQLDDALHDLREARDQAADASARARAEVDERDQRLSEALERLSDAEGRATAAEDNLQHLLRVVLDRLKV